MKKKSQAMVFVSIGIVVFIIFVLVLIFRSSLIKEKSESKIASSIAFEKKVENVKEYIKKNAKKVAYGGVISLGSAVVENYDKILSSYILENFPDVDFSSFKDVDVTFDLNDILVETNKEKTRIDIYLDCFLKIKKENWEREIKSLITSISLIDKCCIPVLTTGNCEAEEDIDIEVCGIKFNVRNGDSLIVGGECIACEI